MRKNNGFTLVELLAVIVILGIIMIISIPAVLDTMQIAQQKSFGEYVSKIYEVSQQKYLEDELNGNISDYQRYDIETDLGLGSTGDYKGYVLFVRDDDVTTVYIGLSNKEYHTVTKYSTDDDAYVNYINYSLSGEPTYTSTLDIYDGVTNSLIKGEVTSKSDFKIPSSKEEAISMNFVEIKEAITPEIMFVNGINEFYSKVKNQFAADVASGALTPSDFGYQMVYPLKQFYPNTSNLGYAVVIGAPNNGMIAISYKDKNYHTQTNMYAYNNDTHTKEHIKEPAVIVVQLTHTLDKLRLQKVDSVPEFDLDERIHLMETTYDDANFMNEELFNGVQYYVRNTYQLGTNDDYFKYETAMSKGYIKMNIGKTP